MDEHERTDNPEEQAPAPPSAKVTVPCPNMPMMRTLEPGPGESEVEIAVRLAWIADAHEWECGQCSLEAVRAQAGRELDQAVDHAAEPNRWP